MANYHAHLKSISRADERSATGAIAYRAACKIVDERTGLEFDYSKKKGVEHTEIFSPPARNLVAQIYMTHLHSGTKLKKGKLNRMHKSLVTLSFHFRMN